jgi:hypothetical protein
LLKLLQIVEGALVYGFDCGLQRGLGRHENDGDLRVALTHCFEQVQPGHARHPDVGYDDVRRDFIETLQRLPPALRHRCLEPFTTQQNLDRVENRALVIHNENLCSH